MKHNLRITLVLTVLFFLAQITGLFIVLQYIDVDQSKATGEIVAEDIVVLGQVVERPPAEGLVGYIIAAILIGTILLLLLIKIRAVRLWKLWFFISVWLLLSIALAPFVTAKFAWLVALFLALWKVLRPNVIVHNLTEVFVYGGLGSLFVLIDQFRPWHALVLLLIISVYDMIAVWKIKHMITLAKFQTKSRVFAGLFVPYRRKEPKRVRVTKRTKILPAKATNAILGGGDIGFPLIFAGVVLKDLVLENSTAIGFLKGLIIPFFVTVALLILFLKGKKDRYYPAMPFLTAGALIGYAVVSLL
jgi:presenilin-like A22 family membrane protease